MTDLGKTPSEITQNIQKMFDDWKPYHKHYEKKTIDEEKYDGPPIDFSRDPNTLPKICLNMIVKDEEHCVVETLESVYKYIDYYIIVDTGSTDNTKKVIKEFFDSKNIKGEIHDVPWRDFGYNRSKALEYCAGKCKYAWMIDADDLVHGELKFPDKMELDGYNLCFGTGFVYWRCQVFRMDKPGIHGGPRWKYEGVLHEYPKAMLKMAKTTYLKGNYFLESRRMGARSKVSDKYRRDAEIFEKRLQEEGENERYRFYLAQSYYDCQEYEKALENYQKRIDLGGWKEELYFSQYRIAICKARLGANVLEVVNAFMNSTLLHPGRAEPYYEIARIFRISKMYRHAYEYGKLGLPLKYNETYLFCTKAVFDFMLKDEVAISAYYIGEYLDSLTLIQQLNVLPELPESYKARLQINFEFSKHGLETVGARARPLLCFYTGYSTIYSNKEVYGSELALISLVKYLKKDYRIVVFSENCEKQGLIDGVLSLPGQWFEKFQEANDIDILVISRYLCFFIEHILRAKKTYCWIHDVSFQAYWSGKRIQDNGRSLIQNMDSKIDKYITLTRWHGMNLSLEYGMDRDKIYVLGNGLNPEQFNKKVQKIPQRFIYTSCPKRGLTVLMKYFHKIHKEFPKAELHIFRGKESFSEEQLDEIENAPYIIHHGGVTHDQSIEEFMKADIWFYPTNYPETYCMSALEAQMAGCICIASNLTALGETVADRGFLCSELYDTDDYETQMLDAVRRALRGEMEDCRIRGQEWARKQTWEGMSKLWRGLFETGIPTPLEAKEVDIQEEKLITKKRSELTDKEKKYLDDLKAQREKTSFKQKAKKTLQQEMKDQFKNKFKKEMLDPKMFVINLDRRKDRYEEFSKRTEEAMLFDVKRFEAVDGNDLVWDDKLKKLFPLDVSTDQKRYESHRRSPGVIGCAMSHYKLWKKMLEETTDPDEIWIIFEDDAQFTNNYLSRFYQYYDVLRKDKEWGVFYLGYIHSEYYYGDPIVANGCAIHLRGGFIRKHGGGTFGYCIRRSAAEYYVNKIESEGMYRAVDWFMIDQFSNVKTYLSIPNLVTSDHMDTDVQG